MSTTAPGPTSVLDTGVTGMRIDLGDLWARRDWLVRKHSEHKERVKTATNVATGDWMVEWPDLSQTPEAPTVANIVEMGVNHWSAIGGSVLPSIRVPVNVSSDRSQGKRGARKRERRLRELWEMSNVSELGALWWGDYAGAGGAYMGAWANFEETDLKHRDPYLIRYDPRHSYAVKDNLGNVTELLVARVISRQELALMYPEAGGMFEKSADEDIEEWFWYSNDRFLHAVVDVGKDGRDLSRVVVMTNADNLLGFVPVWEVPRPTFDGQLRGVFDQTIHILRTMHRLMVLTILSTEEHSFPAVLEYDTVNPEDFGPAGIVHARSADARLERIGPDSHFDVKDLIARLADDAAQQGVWPQQLGGEPGASIVSARGINAAMGALDARLALAHKQFEVGFGKVSGFLLAMDEVYCNAEKQILGDFRDNREAETWIPERDVAGQWMARATYGIGAGSDPANIEVRLSMHLANRLVSRETAMHELPFLDDPEGERVKIFRQDMQDAFVAGVLAQPDPKLSAEALKLLQKDDVDLDEIIEKLVEFVTAPPEPGPEGGDPALAAAQGAESLARGGVPGQAAQAPLPPLGQLLGSPNQVL